MAYLKKAVLRIFSSMILLIVIPVYLFSQDSLFIQNDLVAQDTLIVQDSSIVQENPLIQDSISVSDSNNLLLTDSVFVDIIVHPKPSVNIRSRLVKLEWDLYFPDTVVVIKNMFLPLVFNGKGLDEVDFMIDIPLKAHPFSLGESMPKIFADKTGVGKRNRDLYYNITRDRPDLVVYSYKDFPKEVEKTEEIQPNILQHLFSIEYDPVKTEVVTPERIAPKRKYWRYSGTHKIHFNRYNYSDNWHENSRGNKFMNLISDQRFNFSYSKDKISVENYIYWQFTQTEAKNDTLRRFKIDRDLLEIVSAFKFSLLKNWTYTNRLEIRTPILNRYRENKKELAAAFMCPLNVTLGIIGGTYSLKKNPNKKMLKSITFNVTPSPLTINFNYIRDEDIGSYIYKDRRRQHEFKFGSSIDAVLDLKLYKDIGFNSRFKYKTTYETILIELENKLNLNLNRYFSVNFTFYPRFDDSRTNRDNPTHRDRKWGFVQVYDLLTLGFNYSW